MPRAPSTPGPRRIDGARPTLFERLLDGAPAVYDRDGLARAVARSVERLFSARAADAVDASTTGACTVIDYGVPSTERFAPARDADRARLAEALRAAIAAFEQRLEDPEVAVERDAEDGQRLVARIAGRLRLGSRLEPFAFVAPLDGGGGDGR